MADDKKVTITITSKFDKKGTDEGKKALKETEKQAEKTNETLAKGASNAKGKIVELAAGVDLAKNAFGALQSVGAWIMDCVSAANANTRSVNMLAAAYQNVGFTAAGALETAKKFASEMQKLTGLSDETFLDAQRQLANYKVVGTQAQDAIRAAFALSANQGMAFESALQLITRAAVGNTSALSRYGIVLGEDVKEGDKFAATVAKINEQFGASAQATMGDATTKVNVLKESWGDFKEQLGAGLNEGLSPLVDGLTVAVGWLSQVFKSMSASWAITFDWLFTALQGIKAALLTLGEYAVKSLQPAVSILSYIPFVGEKIEAVFSKANESMANMAAMARQQTATMAEMSTPLRAIWETEKELSAEKQKQIELQAEEINKRRENVDAAREEQAELTQIAQEGAEARAALSAEKDENEKKQKAALIDFKKDLNLRAKKDEQSTFSAVTDMLRQGSKEQMALQKAQGVAQAAISSYQAANSAYSALAGIPIVGPALGAAAAAAALAYGLNNVAQISSIKLAEGGLVKAVTGGVPAVIGEGGSDEAVLPLDNARAMRRIGGAIADESGGLGGGTTINVNINASGGLVPFLDELTEATQNGVSEALRYANVAVKAGNAQGGLSV